MRVVIDGQPRDIDVFLEKKSTGGRPKQILTEEGCKLIENLSRVMCTDEEIATILGSNADTLHNENNRELYRVAKEKGMSEGKQTLRRKQYELAMKGNCSMLIWLGKQWLGQSEKVEAVVDDSSNKKELLRYLEGAKNGELANTIKTTTQD